MSKEKRLQYKLLDVATMQFKMKFDLACKKVKADLAKAGLTSCMQAISAIVATTHIPMA
jgi:hypothetical protein